MGTGITTNYKAWLQRGVGKYGINLNEWNVELVDSPRPSDSHFPHAGKAIIATHPDNNELEIFVDNVWVSDDGEVLQNDAITLLG